MLGNPIRTLPFSTHHGETLAEVYLFLAKVRDNMTPEQVIAALRGVVNSPDLNKLDSESKQRIRQLLHLIEFSLFM